MIFSKVINKSMWATDNSYRKIKMMAHKGKTFFTHMTANNAISCSPVAHCCLPYGIMAHIPSIAFLTLFSYSHSQVFLLLSDQELHYCPEHRVPQANKDFSSSKCPKCKETHSF